MSVTALLGLQWGDEGKGRIVDALSASMEVVVRAQGGANAGHTVKVGERTRVLHLVPSGMLFPQVTGVIGNGVVVDPFTLVQEIDELGATGCEVGGRLLLSDRAHLVLPYHPEVDKALEERRGQRALGTTGRGIGPAYADKAARVGIRAGDLLDPAAAREQIQEEVASKNVWLTALGRRPLDGKDVAGRVMGVAGRLLPFLADTVAFLNDAAQSGRAILVEGAQGALLDVDLGTYPFVTSSNCHLGGLLAGSGLSPRVITRVIGVAKAYCTRVGSGPFPTEDHGRAGEVLREKGREYGATTGRPRRCGWFDAIAARYAARTNGITEIALTKADVLSGQPVVRAGAAYRIDGRVVSEFPSGSRLDRAQPQWREFPGFEADLGAARRFDDLPRTVRDLVAFIEEACGAPVTFVSTGPERDQAIRR
jgi:adenylosuccinate synthase